MGCVCVGGGGRGGGGKRNKTLTGCHVPSPAQEKLPVCMRRARNLMWPPRPRTMCVRCSFESLVLAAWRPMSYLRFLWMATFLPPVARRLCSEWREIPILPTPTAAEQQREPSSSARERASGRTESIGEGGGGGSSLLKTDRETRYLCSTARAAPLESRSVFYGFVLDISRDRWRRRYLCRRVLGF